MSGMGASRQNVMLMLDMSDETMDQTGPRTTDYNDTNKHQYASNPHWLLEPLLQHLD
jgi:hypothetical protein